MLQPLKTFLRNAHDRAYLRFGSQPSREEVAALGFDRVHYACGAYFFDGWLNVDIRPRSRVPKVWHDRYAKMSLTHPHPFADGALRFGYSEDFIEHISQADALVFLSEVYRTLAPGGVLRLSTPSLAAVLKRHFRRASYDGATQGVEEAYAAWGHVHFFSPGSLDLVARHIGFRAVEAQEPNKSKYPELCGLETREEQSDLNLIAELVK